MGSKKQARELLKRLLANQNNINNNTLIAVRGNETNTSPDVEVLEKPEELQPVVDHTSLTADSLETEEPSISKVLEISSAQGGYYKNLRNTYSWPMSSNYRSKSADPMERW